MPTKIRDYTPLLEEAITEAKAAGCEPAATELEGAALAVYTTSSELLQEHGLAIRHFLKIAGKRLPASTRRKLKTCLVETDLACPGWRKLMALLRRRRTLD